MYCQICTNLGGLSADFSYGSYFDLNQHSYSHRSQIDEDRNSPEAERIYFDWCFPNAKKVDIKKEKNNDQEEDSGNKSTKSKIFVEPKKRHVKSNTNNKMSVNDFIRSSITRRPGNSAECNICRASIKYRFSKSLNSASILNHVYSHLKKQLFTCRHCDSSFRTPGVMKSHLYTHHKVSYDKINVIDASENCRAEILATFDQCFTLTQNLKRKSTVQLSFVRPAKIAKKSPTPRPKRNNSTKMSSKLANRKKARRTSVTIHCSNLLQQFGDGTKILCRLCSKTVSMTSHPGSIGFGVDNAINHASGVHLKKPLYECKKCSKATWCRQALTHHLRSAHKCFSAGNYIDYTKNYEADIISIITECYDHNNQKNLVVEEELPAIVAPEPKSSGNLIALFDCNICSFTTRYETLMQKHVMVMHPD